MSLRCRRRRGRRSVCWREGFGDGLEAGGEGGAFAEAEEPRAMARPMKPSMRAWLPEASDQMSTATRVVSQRPAVDP